MDDFDLPSLADFRRLDRWPTTASGAAWKVSAMDPVSITIQSTGPFSVSPRPATVLSDAPPRQRLVVACCGCAAPVAALMLIKGARRVERAHPGCEPLLLVCEFAGDLAVLGVPTFPATFKQRDLLGLIGDATCLIDALVVYDFDHADAPRYREHLVALREHARPACRIVALQPCSSPASARAQFDRVRAGSAIFLAAADALYRELRLAVAERRDASDSRPLEQLLTGALGVEFAPDPHGP